MLLSSKHFSLMAFEVSRLFEYFRARMYQLPDTVDRSNLKRKSNTEMNRTSMRKLITYKTV